MDIKPGISNGVKILVVYATAGAGHKKAAEAVYNEAKSRNLDALLVDVLDYTSPLFKYTYSIGYLFLIKHLPFLWKIIFALTDKPGGILGRIVALFNNLNAKKYIRFLKEENFDLVISTHFMSTQLTARVKPRFKMRLVNVVTDFYPHGSWLSQGVDKYLVASSNVKDKLVSYGIGALDIEVTGIPIHAKFLESYIRAELAVKLGVNPGLFSVLIMTGAIGVGPIAKIIKSISGDTQVMVICGTNNRLFGELNKLERPNLKVFGLVDNVQQLMSVTDVIVTKPGGLTVSESLAKGLPMIFFSIIPGQEYANATLMRDKGAGIIPENVDKIGEIVFTLKEDPKKLAAYKDSVKRLARPNAASDIITLATAR